ncbi:hypothetical protein skT53_26080 [Effusibacillus dendaii]|uniref:Uncharacterized protein n=1 Tax=Effusibacillus dendaii TaxID=2743772 RepID=A0A7I8DBQ8_9BACL|nr:hypothetical protein skT53_26080 [Effusibacillus dendaii]
MAAADCSPAYNLAKREGQAVQMLADQAAFRGIGANRDVLPTAQTMPAEKMGSVPGVLIDSRVACLQSRNLLRWNPL